MKNDLRFALHIITHPFDGFYDLKFEKRGRLYLSFLLIAMMIFTNIFSKMVKGFLFNPFKLQSVNIGYEIQTVIIAFLVISIANWSVTTLLDGKGRMTDIVMVIGYSTIPVTLLKIPSALLSNVSSYSESIYIQGLDSIAMIWFVFLLFTGLMTIHQYSLSKMFFTVVLTVVSVLCMLFIYLLFFSLFSQMAGFILGIIKEISFRV